MKLEKIIIEGNEYYQFVYIGENINTVGDIFSTNCTSEEIEMQRKKFKEQLNR